MSFFYTIIVDKLLKLDQGCGYTTCTGTLTYDQSLGNVQIVQMTCNTGKDCAKEMRCKFQNSAKGQSAFRHACLVRSNMSKPQQVLSYINENRFVTLDHTNPRNDVYKFRRDTDLKIEDVYDHNTAKDSDCELTGGSLKKKVWVLGRERLVTKVGRKQLVVYKGQKIGLTEARELERKLKIARK